MLLSIRNISKTYKGDVKALDDLSFDIHAGMFGLLGPNGAGKSSLMRTLATLQLPDRGQVFFNNKDIFENRHEYRKSLGYLPQDFGVYPKISAHKLLDYFALLKGIASRKARNIAIDKVLEITNLEDVKNKHVHTYSGGMLQRFGIAQLLLNDPQVIIVDEPTAGLDPSERKRFLNVLRDISSSNIVIFSTHLVDDIKELCKDLVIINKGQLRSQISPSKALENLKGKVWETKESTEKLNAQKTAYISLSEQYDELDQQVRRLFSEERPSEMCVPVPPKLEDYYFLTLNTSSNV